MTEWTVERYHRERPAPFPMCIWAAFGRSRSIRTNCRAGACSRRKNVANSQVVLTKTQHSLHGRSKPLPYIHIETFCTICSLTKGTGSPDPWQLRYGITPWGRETRSLIDTQTAQSGTIVPDRFFILCKGSIEEGDDLGAGAYGVGGEFPAAGAHGNAAFHGPCHTLAVINILRYIGEFRISRRLR